MRLESQKNRLKAELTQQVLRFYWFREQCLALQYTTTAVPEEVVYPLTQLYIDRNAEEVKELMALRNPPTGRIKTLEAMHEQEMDAFRSSKGLLIPSLLDADDVEILTDIWDGTKETVSVVPTTGISLGQRSIVDADLQRLRVRLRPIAALRSETASLLPRRAIKFQQSSPAKQKTVSAKKTDDSQQTIQARSKARNSGKQQQRLSKLRSEAIALRRQRSE